ncbi:hypothetical protein [Nostoc sp.]|uniref:hypothetical protein n=1 Tax=Nostoc sp. TaxID=1180 RepID=UPI002FFD36F6
MIDSSIFYSGLRIKALGIQSENWDLFVEYPVVHFVDFVNMGTDVAPEAIKAIFFGSSTSAYHFKNLASCL